jgi:hypothetical protein
MMGTPDTEAAWRPLEEYARSLVAAYKTIRQDRYHRTPPAHLHRDLRRVERAVQSLLQTLIPLELEHREGQDLMVEPFNWPVVQALAGSRTTLEILRRKGLPEASFEVATYPTKLVADLRELREAAHHAAHEVKPRRGQSRDRNPDARDAANIARNLVFYYRATLGVMPPMSSTGRLVALLDDTLSDIGLDGFDAARLLRTAIEADEVGRTLLPSAKAAASKGRCVK